MRNRVRDHAVIGVAVVVAVGFLGAAIALGERGVDGSQMALPLLLALLATLAGTAYVLHRSLEKVIRTLSALTRAARAMAAGSLDQRIPELDRTEAGQLATAFNEMARSLREAFAGMEAERHRVVAVMNTTINGVIALDRDLHISYLNPAAERLLRAQLDDARGKPFLYAIRDQDVHEHLLRVRQNHRQEVLALRVGPQHRYLQVLLTPLADAGAWAFLVVLSDLTEVQRLEGIRRDFVSNVSHELRTPLAGLRAAVETLQAGAYQDPQASPRFFERIVDETERLTNLVDELLLLSRIEAQPPEGALQEPVDLAAMVREMADRLAPLAERAGTQLVLEAGSSGPEVIGDAEQLQRALSNLVRNAIQFTPAGGKVTINVGEEGGRAVVSVRDTGVGISREQQARIFERFYKVDRSRSGEGSGLGLAIVKHIVQAHGGEVSVQSTPGDGSTFTMTLPLRAPVSAPGPGRSQI